MSREVTLYTRRDCGLCDDTAAALEELRPQLGFTLIIRDIDDDAGLRARYNERVPVVASGGRVIAEAPVDALVLRRAIEAALTT